jgi:exodeoxyribonuclease-3
MKFISWNVNGLRACAGKGFDEVFNTLDADFFCLQETKMQPGQLDLEFLGYTSYWNSAEKKGYSGTAIYSRHTPLSVTYGIGVEEHDHEGRVITLEMPEFYLVCVYVPNSQDGLRRLEYRMKWEDDFLAYIKSLDAKKPVIVCGDLNVAHEEIDLKNPKTNRKNAGFTDEERAKMTELPAGAGVLKLLENEDAGAFAHHESVAVLVEGTARAGRVVIALAKRLHGAESGEAESGNGCFGAAGDHHVGVAALDHPEGFADGVAGGGASGDGREVRAFRSCADGDVKTDKRKICL